MSLVVAYLVLVGGLVSLGVWFKLQQLARRSVERVACSGRILSAKVVKNGKVYEPRVLYRYVFNGKEIEGTAIGLATRHSSIKSVVLEAVRPYAPGSEVTVYVFPNDPSDAVLEPALDPGTSLFMLLFSFLFILVGGVLLAGELGFLDGVVGRGN